MALFHSPKIVTDGLILCLDAGNSKSYPGTGTTFYDIASSENHFTLTGLDYNTNNGGYFSFLDNQGDRALKSSSTVLNGRNTLTISMWLRPTSSQTSQSYFSYATSSTYNNELLIFKGPNSVSTSIAVYFASTEYLITNYNLPLNNWLCMTVSCSSSSFTFYENTTAIRTINKNTNALRSSGTIVIGQEQDSVGGGFDNTQDYIGDFAMMHIYDRALTASEIEYNFNFYRKRFGI